MAKSTSFSDASTPKLRLSPEEVIFALCGYGIALLLVVFFGLRGRELEDAARIAGIIEGLAALILAFSLAASAFWFFAYQRNRPRLTVEQEAHVIGRDETGYIVQVTAYLKNEGNLVVELEGWRVWACQLDPMPPRVLDQIRQQKACIDSELEWEYCTGGRLEGPGFHAPRIRGGETQELIATLVVPLAYRLIRIYSSFPHPRLNLQPGEDRVWTRTCIIDLTKGG